MISVTKVMAFRRALSFPTNSILCAQLLSCPVKLATPANPVNRIASIKPRAFSGSLGRNWWSLELKYTKNGLAIVAEG